MSKQAIIKGTLILTITSVATRLLGFYNRIFLTRLIGVKELGIYQLIFPVYILTYAICGQGVSLSLIKNVSYYAGKKDYKACKCALKYSIMLTLFLSLICQLFLYCLAPVISKVILGDYECCSLLRIICIAIPFVVVKSCFNSFFVGLYKPFVQGTSHLYEQIARISATKLLYIFLAGMLLGAKIAVIAVVIGEIIATIYSFCYYLIKIKQFPVCDKTSCPVMVRKKLYWDTIPLSMNNILFTLFVTIEATLFPAMLIKFYGDKELALSMYGLVSGIVVPFLLFPSTITNSLSSLIMPSISYASSIEDVDKIKSTKRNTIAFCSMLGFLAWIFFYLFGELTCKITFGSEEAGYLLKNVGFLCPLLYMCGTLQAIANGLGKTYKNLFINILSISIRIMFIYYLVPVYGINGYLAGMTVSYAISDMLLAIIT